MIASRDGEIGRRSGLKIRRGESSVGVRFPLPAPAQIDDKQRFTRLDDWMAWRRSKCSGFSIGVFVESRIIWQFFHGYERHISEPSALGKRSGDRPESSREVKLLLERLARHLGVVERMLPSQVRAANCKTRSSFPRGDRGFKL